MAKIQGEGDYESARRYNSRTRKFVAAKGAAAAKGPRDGLDEAAERKALSKARSGAQDKRDAKVMASGATAAKKGTRAPGSRRKSKTTGARRKAH